ncbi:flagellar protein FlaG [Wenzhouxiangella limi]|uniref:Flagellar protein FlaG n=1 Tax=Wenzhouxiangella limi TaxID=2707351 RepID=A0A845V499_9GAMM|nr:flagellar protein FlaG [Wenzhouxiangella limi]NDY97120.1 flagellar protein FlaG [Wenzhouxiangella limi]
MDNSISMTRVPPASTSLVETAPRQPAASPPSVSGNAPQPPSAAPPAAAPDEVQRVDLEEVLERVGEQISEYSSQIGRALEFQVERQDDRVVILVTNSDTGELVRSIPSEEVQRLSEVLADGDPLLLDLRA